MTSQRLSSDIVSLVHHVELNESGWWKKAFGQVVQAVLWQQGRALETRELHQVLEEAIGVAVASEALESQLGTLKSQGRVISLANAKVKLSERAREELTDANRKAQVERAECKGRFLEQCRRNCPGLDETRVWTLFTQALVGAVQVAGANLFHLVADGRLERETDWVAAFLGDFPQEDYDGLHRALAAFFAPENQVCRNEVLRLLSAHFFAEASQLHPATLAAIEKGRNKKTIRVVLDTNFIFSVLDLHDNPANEAALSLVKFAGTGGKHLDVRLYALPSTLDEAKRTLIGQLRMVDGIRTTTAMARAAIDQPLPSVAKRYFAAAAANPALTTESFFRPYIDDLKTILAARGIDVLEVHPSVYNTRQDVVDDVVSEQRREQSELPADRRKGYESWLHDIVLWHAVKDRRPGYSDSPFDVEYWAVSIDWRLIAFDRAKRSSGAATLPVVLHPSNLVQLIQFWIPRSKELEASLVDSIRLPLFYQGFDAEDERATIRVLQGLSRFENTADLDEATVRAVLTNRALRNRLKEGDAASDEALELVREELLTVHKDTVKALDTAKETLEKTASELDVERVERQRAEARAREISSSLSAAAEKAEAASRAANEKARALLASRIELAKLRFTYRYVLAPAAAGVVVYLGARDALGWLLGARLSYLGLIAGSISAALIPLALGCAIASRRVPKREELRDWWLARWMSAVGKYAVIAPLTLAGTAIFQGGVWEWFKALTEWAPK